MRNVNAAGLELHLWILTVHRHSMNSNHYNDAGGGELPLSRSQLGWLTAIKSRYSIQPIHYSFSKTPKFLIQNSISALLLYTIVWCVSIVV